MEKIGIIMVQHGDLPFDFKDAEPEFCHMAERMMEMLSEESRKLDRAKWEDPHKEDTEKLADFIRKYVRGELEVGYLDFCRPTIREAVLRLKSKGINRIIFVNTPGLMMRSSHSLIDVPQALKEIAADQDLEMVYARPGLSRGVVDAVAKKVCISIGMPYSGDSDLNVVDTRGYGIVLVAHGDVPLEYIKANGKHMKKSEHYVEQMSEMACRFPRNEANDPLYFDAPLAASQIKMKGGFDDFEVAHLEFSKPNVGEVVGQMAGRGIKKLFFVGGTGFSDRSSHSLIDIPAAIQRQRLRFPGIEMTYVKPDIEQVMPELAGAVLQKIREALSDGIVIKP